MSIQYRAVSLHENMVYTTMKYILSVIILLFTINASGQLRPVYGKVVDEQGSPVPYALVLIKDRNNGAYTEENGVFYLELDPVTNSKLIVSCVGYEKKEVALPKSVKDSLVVTLKGNMSIPEVSITAKQGVIKEMKLGKDELVYKGQVYFNIGDEMAVFLPVEKKRRENGYLKNVFIYVTSIGNEASKVRLHVYDEDPNTGEPMNEITGANIIVNAHEGNAWLHVDLSKYKIPVKGNGVYLGIEWIDGYGNDPKEKWRRGLFTYHSPVIGFTQSYGGKHKRYCKLGFSSTWRDGEYKRYRLSPMVYGSYTYKDYGQ